MPPIPRPSPSMGPTRRCNDRAHLPLQCGVAGCACRSSLARPPRSFSVFSPCSFSWRRFFAKRSKTMPTGRSFALRSLPRPSLTGRHSELAGLCLNIAYIQLLLLSGRSWLTCAVHVCTCLCLCLCLLCLCLCMGMGMGMDMDMDMGLCIQQSDGTGSHWRHLWRQPEASCFYPACPQGAPLASVHLSLSASLALFRALSPFLPLPLSPHFPLSKTSQQRSTPFPQSRSYPTPLPHLMTCTAVRTRSYCKSSQRRRSLWSSSRTRTSNTCAPWGPSTCAWLAKPLTFTSTSSLFSMTTGNSAVPKLKTLNFKP